MYIYLNNTQELQNSLVTPENSTYRQLTDITVWDDKGIPHVETTEDYDLLSSKEELKKFFLKATIVTFPGYSKNIYENKRELGIYRYGKAKAELVPGENKPYWLKIETLSWEGISDMKILQEKLWAGTIAPYISYEEKQVKRHPLDILAQILDSKSLNKVQRFFLALRLTKQKR